MDRAGPLGSSFRAPQLGATAAQLATLALVAAATAARVWIGEVVPGLLPFNLYLPVVLAAALLGGWPAAVTGLLSTTLLGWWLFMGPIGPAIRDAATLVNLLLYVFSAGCMALAGVYVRALVVRLQASAERLSAGELRYRTLFDAIAEGFALVEPVRDADGRMVDYRILEANPAVLAMLGGRDLVGRTGSEVFPRAPAAWIQACERALAGKPLAFEFQAPTSGAWYEVRLTRVTEHLLAQFMLDITDRKKAEARQSELFDELNHRVKNNLAMISSMLSLQARMGDGPRVKEHLDKACDRIRAIAEVHASLYRSGGKDEVDFASYLQDLCDRLARSLLEGDRVAIDVEAEPAVMPLDKAVALGVVINELVTNAAKYAYPPPSGGRIAVRLEEAPGGLVLSVGDSGEGLPADIPSSGLGMRLVRSLVQQIGATLEIEHHPGATFRVRLPGAQPRAAPAAATVGQARLF